MTTLHHKPTGKQLFIGTKRLAVVIVGECNRFGPRYECKVTLLMGAIKKGLDDQIAAGKTTLDIPNMVNDLVSISISGTERTVRLSIPPYTHQVDALCELYFQSKPPSRPFAASQPLKEDRLEPNGITKGDEESEMDDGNGELLETRQRNAVPINREHYDTALDFVRGLQSNSTKKYVPKKTRPVPELIIRAQRMLETAFGVVMDPEEQTEFDCNMRALLDGKPVLLPPSPEDKNEMRFGDVHLEFATRMQKTRRMDFGEIAQILREKYRVRITNAELATRMRTNGDESIEPAAADEQEPLDHSNAEFSDLVESYDERDTQIVQSTLDILRENAGEIAGIIRQLQKRNDGRCPIRELADEIEIRFGVRSNDLSLDLRALRSEGLEIPKLVQERGAMQREWKRSGNRRPRKMREALDPGLEEPEAEEIVGWNTETGLDGANTDQELECIAPHEPRQAAPQRQKYGTQVGAMMECIDDIVALINSTNGGCTAQDLAALIAAKTGTPITAKNVRVYLTKLRRDRPEIPKLTNKGLLSDGVQTKASKAPNAEATTTQLAAVRMCISKIVARIDETRGGCKREELVVIVKNETGVEVTLPSLTQSLRTIRSEGVRVPKLTNKSSIRNGRTFKISDFKDTILAMWNGELDGKRYTAAEISEALTAKYGIILPTGTLWAVISDWRRAKPGSALGKAPEIKFADYKEEIIAALRAKKAATGKCNIDDVLEVLQRHGVGETAKIASVHGAISRWRKEGEDIPHLGKARSKILPITGRVRWNDHKDEICMLLKANADAGKGNYIYEIRRLLAAKGITTTDVAIRGAVAKWRKHADQIPTFRRGNSARVPKHGKAKQSRPRVKTPPLEQGAVQAATPKRTPWGSIKACIPDIITWINECHARGEHCTSEYICYRLKQERGIVITPITYDSLAFQYRKEFNIPKLRMADVAVDKQVTKRYSFWAIAEPEVRKFIEEKHANGQTCSTQEIIDYIDITYWGFGRKLTPNAVNVALNQYRRADPAFPYPSRPKKTATAAKPAPVELDKPLTKGPAKVLKSGRHMLGKVGGRGGLEEIVERILTVPRSVKSVRATKRRGKKSPA